jgi:hypothetical protein
MPSVKQESTNQPSTASYATLLRARVIGFTKCTLTVTNSDGVNAIKFKILVSNDLQGAANTWAVEKTEDVLAAGAAYPHILSGAFCWVDVLIVDESAGDHGIGNCWLQACGL